MFANAKELNKKDLYIPNTIWQPEPPHNPDLAQRVFACQTALKKMFMKVKKAKKNLLASQDAGMRWLLEHPEIIIANTDKNLGPCAMEREEYIRYAWQDHLSDTATYRQLSNEELLARVRNIRISIQYFCDIYKSVDKSDLLYIERYTDAVSNDKASSYMYLMPKIHKTPLKTRAIISYSGSICQGLALWVDKELKKIIKHLPFVATSSISTKVEICARRWCPSALLFTMDATSMYTNIHLAHALPIISDFLNSSEKGIRICKKESINCNALTRALELVMSNNIFKFGDTNWLQLAGTAMGTPPAPNWATLYFNIWEIQTINDYPELSDSYYKRYIDDGFGIWVPHTKNETDDLLRFKKFQKEIQSFGADHEFFLTSNFKPLQWTFSKRTRNCVFLDLNITLTSNGIINTSIFEKELNLHLYLPPHSCHSPGVVKGLIFGMVHRAKSLCSDTRDAAKYITQCFWRLRHRGYQHFAIKPIFTDAIAKVFNNSKPSLPSPTNSYNALEPLFFHLPFNPSDPPTQSIQRSFRNHLLYPPNKSPINETPTNNNFNGTCDFERVVICYSKQKSLKSILSPRKGRYEDGYSVSARLEQLTWSRTEPTHSPASHTS